jgi:hypothetical protein
VPPLLRQVRMWFAGGDGGDADDGRFYPGVVTACTARWPEAGDQAGDEGWGGVDVWECVTVKWDDDPVETQVRQAGACGRQARGCRFSIRRRPASAVQAGRRACTHDSQACTHAFLPPSMAFIP